MTMDNLPLVAVLIVGAGSGSRASTETGFIPKQFFPLEGRTLFQRTVNAFAGVDEISQIVCVVPVGDEDWPLPVLENNSEQKTLSFVTGGQTRQRSVLNGLRALQEQSEKWDIVLVHDAARPFVSPVCIQTVISDAALHGGSIAAVPVVDSLKHAKPGTEGVGKPFVSKSVPREGIFQAQTPQGFEFAPLINAHERALADGRYDYSDDAMVFEAYVGPVALSAGDRNNWKITEPQDFELARQILQSQKDRIMIPDVRVGHGYDVHAFETGDEIILCGVKLPHDKALKGHSDADVGLHALTDAVLGALADGDIGSHFPPSDPKWKAASSDQFLQHAVGLATARGALITHLDVTMVCETPKIGPHREQMRKKISEISGVSHDRVSVKATTSEKLGFTGRKEGISAMATATLVFPIEQSDA
ncbi:MAG: bifunctional 2-C-methyl-D-erythritol 4-phosphate cytidylyltransferase/2-C-methyl-D-erythritol 2,4-cyclodiphosphate synthase [Hyphomicrobiales bacterium]